MEKRDAQLRDQEEELKQKDVEISRLGRELRQCQTQLEQVCLNLASSWGGGTLTIAFAIVLLILSVHVHEGLHRTCSVCPSLCVTMKSATYITSFMPRQQGIIALYIGFFMVFSRFLLLLLCGLAEKASFRSYDIMFVHERNLHCSDPLDMQLLVHALVLRVLHTVNRGAACK